MNDMKKAAAADIVILVVIMLVSAYMFAASGAFADETKLFPRIVSTAVFLCCAVKLTLTVRACGRTEGQCEKKRLFSRKQAVVLAASALYVALLTPIGFLPCTIAVLIALPYALGYRRWKVLIPFAVVITVAFYAIFRYGFYIKLPAGVLSGLL